MPLRTLSAGWNTHLSGAVLTLALCVKVTRLDGVRLGFTSHDRPITLQESEDEEDLLTYEASSSLEASALRQEATTGVDNLEVIGLLSSESIADSDLRAGLYDGAAVEFFVVNWRDLSLDRIILLSGNMGEVVFQTGQFSAEVRSLIQRAQQSVGELTSPLCRVKQLGDNRCKIDTTPFRFNRTVSQVDSVYQFRVSGDVHATDYFTYGVAEFSTGANAGISREIKNQTQAAGVSTIVLQEPFPFAVAVSDTLVLEAGCDRRFSTCRDKFDNVVNFRGEPTIPGNDQILKVGRKQ